MTYYEATERGDLAHRIAQRVKDAERQLAGGTLETKEVRNAVEVALRDSLTFEAEPGRHRFVTRWVHHPVQEDATGTQTRGTLRMPPDTPAPLLGPSRHAL